MPMLKGRQGSVQEFISILFLFCKSHVVLFYHHRETFGGKSAFSIFAFSKSQSEKEKITACAIITAVSMLLCIPVHKHDRACDRNGSVHAGDLLVLLWFSEHAQIYPKICPHGGKQKGSESKC